MVTDPPAAMVQVPQLGAPLPTVGSLTDVRVVPAPVSTIESVEA
jgi:hypothetical protein